METKKHREHPARARLPMYLVIRTTKHGDGALSSSKEDVVGVCNDIEGFKYAAREAIETSESLNPGIPMQFTVALEDQDPEKNYLLVKQEGMLGSISEMYSMQYTVCDMELPETCTICVYGLDASFEIMFSKPATYRIPEESHFTEQVIRRIAATLPNPPPDNAVFIDGNHPMSDEPRPDLGTDAIGVLALFDGASKYTWLFTLHKTLPIHHFTEENPA